MHELSIALAILDIASEESERRAGVPVRAIHIRLGPLSGVVTEALQSAFELARESSPFGDCRLVVEEVPLRIYCRVCEAEGAVDSVQLMCCGQCGTPAAELVGGNEMEITAMEIEEPSDTDRSAIMHDEVAT